MYLYYTAFFAVFHAFYRGEFTGSGKVFNLREGATREQDTLPKRMFREPLNEGRDVITVEELDFMLDEYYKLRGWDSQRRP
ncbi:aldehyde ferredoxin oxidoreductase C-terminal domain-containing protein [Desulfosporosinus sp. BICA1-9]|uniref:aldehyde ferredoxin oxidoreductase C-terminal domain-containing protein n=1 Tax=Desulfosporosinus sp. BICA1-9 TaxID=1531958 RepID=UPI0025C01DC2|nr:aldehyde ferredoxin oxidoreductase C-terminal domain-containing protein [Desulfosporosinus sp. BICA1-9]